MYNFSYHNFHVEIVPVGQRWDIKLTHSWPFYTARSGSCSLIFHVHQIVAITYHAFRSHPCWEKNQGAYFIFLLTVFPIFIPITLCRSTAVGLAKTMPVGTFSSLLMGSIIATAKEFIIEIWRSITAKFQEKKKRKFTSIWHHCAFLIIVQPENLLLDSRGNLKISDFGLSALPPQVNSIYSLIIYLQHIRCPFMFLVLAVGS